MNMTGGNFGLLIGFSVAAALQVSSVNVILGLGDNAKGLLY